MHAGLNLSWNLEHDPFYTTNILRFIAKLLAAVLNIILANKILAENKCLNWTYLAQAKF